jgi:hypothetical protein
MAFMFNDGGRETVEPQEPRLIYDPTTGEWIEVGAPQPLATSYAGQTPMPAPPPSSPTEVPTSPVRPDAGGVAPRPPVSAPPSASDPTSPAPATPSTGPAVGDNGRPDLVNAYSMVPAYYSGVRSRAINPATLNYFLREKIRRGELRNLYDPSKKPVTPDTSTPGDTTTGWTGGTGWTG